MMQMLMAVDAARQSNGGRWTERERVGKRGRRREKEKEKEREKKRVCFSI